MSLLLRPLILGAALAASGCIIQPDPGPAPSNLGTVEIQWTINGRVDPNLCSQGSAPTLAVDVVDSRGSVVGSYDAPCTDFATSIDLYSGTYSADATLLDARGGSRTTTVTMTPFRIIGGSTLVVSIDFPSSSFY